MADYGGPPVERSTRPTYAVPRPGAPESSREVSPSPAAPDSAVCVFEAVVVDYERHPRDDPGWTHHHETAMLCVEHRLTPEQHRISHPWQEPCGRDEGTDHCWLCGQPRADHESPLA